MIEAALAISGWVGTEDQLEWLCTQAARFDTVVEIGCWLGQSAAALAIGCPGQVWTVDHFLGSPSERTSNHREASERDLYLEAVANLAAFGNVKVIRGASVEVAKVFGDVDMVWLDGDHDEAAVRADIQAWGHKAMRLLCGHDIDWPGVAAALAAERVPFSLGPGSIWYSERG